MKKEMRKTETWLPLFPGFYHTLFEFDEIGEFHFALDSRAETGLKGELDISDLKFDYKRYKADVVKNCGQAIEGYLSNIGFKCSFKFVEIISPREYNFTNDRAFFEVSMTEDEFQKLIGLIYENEDAIDEYIYERYTSMSGFHSFHSNRFAAWEKELNGFENLMEDAHKFGAILDALLLINEYDAIGLYYDIEINECKYLTNDEQVYESHKCSVCGNFVLDTGYLQQKYDKLIEKGNAYFAEYGRRDGQKIPPTTLSFREWVDAQELGDICYACRLKI